MNFTSRTITGTTMIILGIILMVLPVFTSIPNFIFLIYSIILIIIGSFILLNRNEDVIEERKDLNKKRTKK